MRGFLLPVVMLAVFGGLFGVTKATDAQDLDLTEVIISLELNEVPLKTALNEIEKQAELTFAFSYNAIDPDRSVSVKVHDESVDEVLKQLFQARWVSWALSGKTIMLKKWPEQDDPDSAFDEPIEGQVTDAETGETLPGVNILVKGTTIGSSTDQNGDFGLMVPSLEDTLVVSFIGYQTQEVPINGRAEISIALSPEAIMGEEMVVVGYGEQEQSTLTEAISSIDGDEIVARPTANLTQSLQGKLPGLNIKQSGGNPSESPNINIRGFTSINGGEPLILINGVEGEISRINPKDVESISVLKDAAAAAVYGARAAYGVILVTTKDAQEGEVQVNYTNTFGWQTMTRNTDYVTDPYKAARLVDESFRMATGNSYTGYNEEDYEELQRRSEDPSLPDVVVDNRNGREQYIYYGNTDWWNTLFQKFYPMQSHDLSISGGTDQLSLKLSGRMYENEGILKVQDDTYDSYNGRIKINYKLNDWLTFSNNFYVNSSKQIRHGGSMYGWEDPLANTIYVHGLPSYVPRNPDGSLTFRTELNNYTPLDGSAATLLYGKHKKRVNRREYGNTIEATITPVKNFEFRANYTNSVDYFNETRRSVEVPWSINPGEIEYFSDDQLWEERHKTAYKALNIYGKYNQDINKHQLEGTIGMNYEHSIYDNIDATKRNLLSDDLSALDLGSSGTEAYGNAGEWAVLGYFLRFNYNYDERYLLQFNGRYDGSSRFPTDHRWGLFPSVSAGWIVSNEDFFKELRNTISQLKVRGSYGSLGNQQVPYYAYTPTLSKETVNYVMEENQRLEYVNPLELNPRDITWEKVNTVNFGLDLGLIKNKIKLNIDLYQRRTIGMLTQGRRLPAVLGAPAPEENAANLRTRGFEAQLSYQNSFTLNDEPFNLSLTASLSNQKSVITKFDNPNNFIEDYYVGQEIGELWGYHVDGLFQSNEEAANHADQARVNYRIESAPGEFGRRLAGDVKYVDLNGDGIISEGENTLENPGDRRIIGNVSPKLPYSFSISADWNNIDLSTYFQGIGKQDWYPNNDSRLFWGPHGRPYNSFIRKDLVEKTWSEDNPDAYYPRLRGYHAESRTAQLGTVNDRYLQSVAYLRLKNLTIGYTLPQDWTNKIGSGTRVRLYFSGENLLTFSSLTDYVDPEAASNGVTFSQGSASYGRGATAQTYPFNKIYSIGINLDF